MMLYIALTEIDSEPMSVALEESTQKHGAVCSKPSNDADLSINAMSKSWIFSAIKFLVYF